MKKVNSEISVEVKLLKRIKSTSEQKLALKPQREKFNLHLKHQLLINSLLATVVSYLSEDTTT